MTVTLREMLENPAKFLSDERIQKKLEEIKRDKGKLSKITDEYNHKYEQEVAEGTEKRKLLIEDGARKGLKEEEALAGYGKFLPSVQTPLLNFLFFFMRDNSDKESDLLREEYNKQYGHLREEYSSENRKYFNPNDNAKVFSNDEEEDVKALPVTEQPEFTKELLYGNMSHDEYAKVRKLKALSMSDNEHEAAEAFIACNRLCKKYGLQYDKIPFNLDNK